MKLFTYKNNIGVNLPKLVISCQVFGLRMQLTVVSPEGIVESCGETSEALHRIHGGIT